MEPYPGQKAGSTVFHFKGHDYHQDNLAVITTANYKCARSSCKGRARHSLTEPNEVHVTIHNHARDASRFKTYRMREALRKRAKEDLNTSISEIFRQISAQFVDVAELVNPVTEKKAMRRARKAAFPSVLPETFAELGEALESDGKIREMFGKTAPLPEQIQKEDYFMKKLEGPEGTSLVFASPSLIKKSLETCTKVQIDGTFKVMPVKPKGRQLLSVHAIHGDKAFPVIFVLMESKKKKAYKRFFKYVKEELAPGWSPEVVSVDFEKAVRIALKGEFPHALIIGCYFHFTQAIQKRWSQFGMMRLPIRWKEQAKDLKDSIMALPFAPADKIKSLFEEIDENITIAFRLRAKQFLKYFKSTWLSENDRNFKPEDYSIYGHPDRTNNHLESFHSRLHLKKPSLWKFLNLLIEMTVESRQNYGRFMNGIPFTPPIPLKVLWTEQRIVRARALFEAHRIPALQFIRWCRQVTRDTQAIVRQGRCLRRYLKAEYAELEYDDVATSSDDSLDSNSMDWEYDPNPHQAEVMAAQDEEADAELEELVANGEADDNHSIIDEMEGQDEESIPSETDSIWNVEEDEAILELSQNIFEIDHPQVPPPHEPANAGARPPNACVYCMSEVAVWAALPCTHCLVCITCKPLYMEEHCSRCNMLINDFIRIITT